MHILNLQKSINLWCMPVNPKYVLEKLRGNETDRGRVTLYLDKNLFKRFQEVCDDVSASRVLEEYMREFVESARGDSKKASNSK